MEIIDDFIGKVFPQKGGDDLLVVKKTDKKTSYGAILYCCQFQKYPCEVLAPKTDIKRGNIGNPQKEKIEFYDKIHIQKNGDKIQVLEKTENKKGGYFLYKCKSLIYNNILYLTKSEILKSQIINPQIEYLNFVSKLWPQNCGDTLKIIEKTNQKTSNITNHYLWKCIFIKYPYEVLAEKGNIIKGRVNNSKIEEIEFASKTWKQNCGSILEIFERHSGGNYRCRFIGYNKDYYATEEAIKKGTVQNRELPWFSKESLKQYIEENFSEKPTYTELASKLGISISHLNNKIIKFNLTDLIYYFEEGSKVEKDIKEFVQSLIPNEKISNSWDELDGKEIDIYIPDLRIGIEYNGNLWHSNHPKYGVKNFYHQNKSILAQEKNIFIIHIFEYEWNEKQEILKSLIKSKLGIFNKKIGARKCIVKEILNKEYQDFCNKNHLQGEAGAKIKLGLFYKNELVQIMSFGCPRFTDKYEWEIIRECSKLDYIVLGGKEKLWNYFVKNYLPKNCISYCDFSKFTGESYLKLGFKKERLNKPGFVWYDEKINLTYWRNPFKHNEYKEKYLKIYDAGQLVFIWNK